MEEEFEYVKGNGNTLPPLNLQWSNVSFTVPVGKYEKKQVLNNITGSVNSGQVLAVLGPSGCGKTSLMNILSGRMYAGKATGEVYLNGQQRTSNWPDLCGYVQQDDVLYENLTVWETLQFAGKVRLPKGTPQSVIDDRAKELMAALGLTHAANTYIGNSVKKGISGGERKRLIVATELFDRPRLLFLDEPTSGLDSASAILLIEALTSLARKEGSIVILTIHQPRASIFNGFDLVSILSKGNQVYFGPPSQAAQYWQSMGFQIPMMDNPADFYLDTVTVNGLTDDVRQQQQEQVDKLVQAWQKSELHYPKSTLTPVDITRGVAPGMTRPNWFDQFNALLKRNWTLFVRDKKGFVSLITQTLVIALFLGLVFFQMTDNQGALLLRLLAIFFVTLVTLVINCFPTVSTFAMERKVLVRERSSNSYAPSAFYLAKLVILLPLVTISNIVIVSISYWMMGFINDVSSFFLYMVSVILMAWMSQALGLAIASWVENPATGAGIAQIAVLVFIVFGGLFSGFLPVWISWIQWLSIANYAFRAMAQLCLAGLKFRCQTIGPNDRSTVCLVTGDDALQMFAVNYPAPWICILICLGWFFFYHILAMIGVQVTTKKKPIIV